MRIRAWWHVLVSRRKPSSYHVPARNLGKPDRLRDSYLLSGDVSRTPGSGVCARFEASCRRWSHRAMASGNEIAEQIACSCKQARRLSGLPMSALMHYRRARAGSVSKTDSDTCPGYLLLSRALHRPRVWIRASRISRWMANNLRFRVLSFRSYLSIRRTDK